MTSALDGVGWSSSRPSRLYPRERPGTHCTGGWVGPRAGLDRCGKSRPTGIRSLDLPAHSKSLFRLHFGRHIAHILWALSVHYCFYKSLPLVLVLSHLSPMDQESSLKLLMELETWGQDVIDAEITGLWIIYLSWQYQDFQSISFWIKGILLY